MLDVIFTLFEDDMLPKWDQESQVKDDIRGVLYRSLYNKEYKYGYSSRQGRTSEWVGGDSIYDTPSDGAIKPYFPPSSQEELFSILDGPMGE